MGFLKKVQMLAMERGLEMKKGKKRDEGEERNWVMEADGGRKGVETKVYAWSREEELGR